MEQLFYSDDVLISLILGLLLLLCGLSVFATLLFGARFSLQFRRLAQRVPEAKRLELNSRLTKSKTPEFTHLPISQLLTMEVKLQPKTLFLKEMQELGVGELRESCTFLYSLKVFFLKLSLVLVVALCSFIAGLFFRSPSLLD